MKSFENFGKKVVIEIVVMSRRDLCVQEVKVIV